MQGYTTESYRLHYLEIPTGLVLVLNTDPQTPDQRELLRKIYSDLYVELITKNPLSGKEEVINNELFRTELQNLLASQQHFA